MGTARSALTSQSVLDRLLGSSLRAVVSNLYPTFIVTQVDTCTQLNSYEDILPLGGGLVLCRLFLAKDALL